LFFNQNKSGIRSENEFIQAYVAANMKPGSPERNSGLSAQTGFGGSSTQIDMSNVTVMPSKDALIENAQDAYEDLVEAYETLKKDPDAQLGLETIDPELSGNGGINRFFSRAAGYAFDSAVFNSTSFDMAKDFYVKDLMPKTASDTFLDDYGISVVSGISGFDLTAEDLADETIFNEKDQKSSLATLKAFLGSAMINAGGKTGENQMRPTGNYYLHAIAANDGNKVAMTWELSPAWVKAHAGKDGERGIAWDLQQKINESKPATITFIMDADKAASSPFKAMQLTKNEMLMNMTGKVTLDAYKEMGGNLEIVPNALGGYTYSGQARSVNAVGQILNVPIYGTTTADINSVVNFFNKRFDDFTRGNMQYMSTLKESSQNKIYDPAQLNQS
jgi:hypothetical protein